MDLKKLPFLPLHFFFYQFSSAGKRLFVFMLMLLVLASALMVFVRYQPVHWALEVKEVPETFTGQVKVDEIQNNYRTFDLDADAFRHLVSFTAGPIQPHPTPVILFIIFQMMAWSMALVASTLLRSRWYFAICFLFALFIHFSGIGSMLYPGDNFHLLEFGIMIVFLFLAYAFQSGMLKWGLGWRFASIAGLMSLVFGIAYYLGGWEAFHRSSVEMFYFLVALSVPFLLFIGKDITNLIVAAANNRKHPRARRGFGWVLLVWLLLFVMEFLLFHDLVNLNWLPYKGSGRLATILIAIAAVATAFTSQNQLHQVKKIFESHRVFAFLLISWALIVISFLFLFMSNGDYMFRHGIERLATIFFMFVGLGHILYIFYNHYPLFIDKINVYYLLGQGPRLRMAAIWIVGLIGLVIAEGRQNWVSTRLFVHNQKVARADLAEIAGDQDLAMRLYDESTKILPLSVKANYKLASFMLNDTRTVSQAIERYKKASSMHHFPYATINAGNILLINNQAERAKTLLSDPAFRKNDPYIQNNLGLIYFQQDEPDSAIVNLKRALLAAPGHSSVYSNLGQVYWHYEKADEALNFLNASLDLRNPSPYAIANATYFRLGHAFDIEIPEKALGKSNDFYVRYNYMLSLVNEGRTEQALPLIRELSRKELSPDAMLMDAYSLFSQDSLGEALSRFKFVKLSFPSHAARAEYQTALAYFSRDLPEMAALHFHESGNSGDPKGFLYEAKMDIDQGNAQLAEKKLSKLRVDHSELWPEVSRELAMLLEASGAHVYALTEWDFADITPEERIRISLYADSLNQYITALENFRGLIATDSTDARPYLEMGRIYRKYKDPQAIDNLKYGLVSHPDFTPLKVALGLAHLDAGNIEEAKSYLAEVKEAGFSFDSQFMEAEIAFASQDTVSALALLEELLAKDALNKKVILRLAEIYDAVPDPDAGYRTVYKALNYNTQNPDIWYYYARFSKAWNQQKDAGFGAVRAIELTQSEIRKKQIAAEFAAEIKLISEGK